MKHPVFPLKAELSAHFEEAEIILIVHHRRHIQIVFQYDGRLLQFAIVVHIAVLNVRLGMLEDRQECLVEIVDQVNSLVLVEIFLNPLLRVVNVLVRAQRMIRDRLPGNFGERIP